MNKTISKFNIPNFSRFVNPSIHFPKFACKHRCVRLRQALKTASVFCLLHLIRHQFVTAKAFYPLLLMIYYFISSAYIINLKRLSSTLGEIIASITLILYALRCRRSADYLGIVLNNSSSGFFRFCLIIRYVLPHKAAYCVYGAYSTLVPIYAAFSSIATSFVMLFLNRPVSTGQSFFAKLSACIPILVNALS